MNKEEIEKSNVFKASISIITDEELKKIDNNFDSIVNEFVKQLIHQKDLSAAQYIIKKQQQYIEQLENKVKELEKGNNSLMQSRKKWKDRYYKEKNDFKSNERR